MTQKTICHECNNEIKQGQTPITCACGYHWHTRSKLRKVGCPSCHNNTKRVIDQVVK